ncbi:MAG: AAA family ATPase [Lachnospiraceae bacterium]|nr:AAA family ATPase [Lachnospiraceae bacterium]
MESRKHSKEDAGLQDFIDFGQLFLDFFRYVRKYWLPALLVILICGGGYSFIKSRTTVLLYESQSTFTVGMVGAMNSNTSYYYSTTAAAQMSNTFPYILESDYFRNLLLDVLGETELEGSIKASVITSSNMVTMSATAESGQKAAEILKAAMQIYPKAAYFVLGAIEFYIINEPSVPTEPINAVSPGFLFARGAVFGALLSGVSLLFLAIVRRDVRTDADVEEVSDMKCLGQIPLLRRKASSSEKTLRLWSVLDERTPYEYRESMRSAAGRLLGALRKLDPDEEESGGRGKVILVTSTAPGEGKSTLAVNLAEELTREGKQVVLVDADLRKQGDAVLAGAEVDSVGLIDILGKGGDAYIKRVPAGFAFVGSSGKVMKNPVGLLSDSRMGAVIKSLASAADIVIIDTPPCGGFQDTSILAPYADGILYIVRYDKLTRDALGEALYSLSEASAPLLGYVLNGCPEGGSRGYGHYGYGRYGYGHYGYGRYGSRGYGKE